MGTELNDLIRFFDVPVYQFDSSIEFKITRIEPNQTKKIYSMIEGFRAGQKFLQVVEENGIIQDWSPDKVRKEIEISFERV